MASASSLASLAMLLSILPCCLALDAKWTPNGEAPAPFSTNARNQMGMDPAAMAGQAGQATAIPPAGSIMKFNVVTLLIVYLCNNWKLVAALQEIVMSLLQPLLGAAESRKQAAAAAAKAEAAAAARRARVSRLKASGGRSAVGKSKAAAVVDDDDDEDED
jgi:hypothetical protein